MTLLDFTNLNKIYINKNLNLIEDNRELLLISFRITDSHSISVFKKLWSKYDNNNKAVGRDEKATQKSESNKIGGCVTLIDPYISDFNKYNILAEVDVMAPHGLCVNTLNNELLIGTSFEIKRLINGQFQSPIKNNLFNSIHCIKPSKNGIYVVSASFDC